MVLFYAFFSGLVMASALLILLTPHMLYAVLGLLCMLLGMAAVYFLQGASFVAVAYVIVYGSGVAVLILFSALLLPLYHTKAVNWSSKRLLGTLIATGLTGGLLWLLVRFSEHALQQKSSVAPLPEDTIVGLGLQLLGPYALAFEWIGLSLLIALVGSACIMRKA
ncbi:MAG: NADH-quinone oxidoreductase subunit J family protein [Bacteroidota bacterium]